MKIIVDVDGVLAEFNHSFASELGLQVTQEWEPTRWHWPDEMASPEAVKQAWESVNDPKRSFWYGLPAYPETREALERFSVLSQSDDLYFVTSRSGDTAKCQTEDWLFTMGMVMDDITVITVERGKAGIAHDIQADVVVEDRPENLIAIRKELPNARLYLVDRAWNKEFQKGGTTHHNITVVNSILDALELENL